MESKTFRVKHFAPLLMAIVLTHGMSVGWVKAGELTREQAIRIALENNPEVTAAQKDWEIARAGLTQARAFPDPELEFEYEELPGVSNIDRYGERNIGISQKIEFPVKWWLRNRSAGRRAQAVRMAVYEMTKLEVATSVKIALDRILLQQEVLNYTKKNLGLAEELLQKAQIRFDAGDVSQLEVLRAEVETGRAENRVTVARNELSVARAELNALLARDVGIPLKVAGEFVFRPVNLDLGRLKKIALDNRPDLVGARFNVAAARLNRSMAVSSIVPDLNIGVFRQRIKTPVGGDNFWHVRLGMEAPIWALFRQRGEITQAHAEADQAIAVGNAVRYRVMLEVESAYLDLKAAEEQVCLFQDRILLKAERAYEVAGLSYDEGKLTYLELLEAQRVLTQTSMDYAGTIFNFLSIGRSGAIC